MKFSLKPLTEKSWILSSNGERIGLVSEIDSVIKVIGRISPGLHQSWEDFERSLGSKPTIEQPHEPPQERERGEIDGYPVKHPEWHNTMTEPVPSYTRSAKSNNRYGAGYYALKFSHGWTAALCPKLVTLTEYEYIGPFRTKLEMQHQISAKNKAVNV